MPVKTRKPTRGSRREPDRSRHSARSQTIRSLGIADSTVGENSTISSLKRGIAAAHSAPSRTVSLLSSQPRTQPTVLRSSSHPSKAKVMVTTDAWYDLLAKNPDLCYLSLSGQFNRKNGCILKNVNGSYSIEHFFADLYSQQSYSPQVACIEIHSHSTFKGAQAEVRTHAALDSAIKLGS